MDLNLSSPHCMLWVELTKKMIYSWLLSSPSFLSDTHALTLLICWRGQLTGRTYRWVEFPKQEWVMMWVALSLKPRSFDGRSWLLWLSNQISSTVNSHVSPHMLPCMHELTSSGVLHSVLRREVGSWRHQRITYLYLPLLIEIRIQKSLMNKQIQIERKECVQIERNREELTVTGRLRSRATLSTRKVLSLLLKVERVTASQTDTGIHFHRRGVWSI